MTYFSLRSTEAVCDKPASRQLVFLVRFHPNIFRTRIGIVASVTQEALGLVSYMYVFTLNFELRGSAVNTIFALLRIAKGQFDINRQCCKV